MGVAKPIDVTAPQRKLILSLLNKFLPNTEVWAFGSRVKFTTRPASDLDLVAFIKPEQAEKLSDLKDAFTESDLPFKVDLHDWYSLPDKFKKNIEKEYVILQDVNKTKSISSGKWKPYKLSEVLELIGGGTPKTTVPEYWNGDIPWLSVVDFGNDQKHVYKTEKTITEKGLKESSTRILQKGQIIISARGTVGELAVLGKDMAFNQSCYGITANEKTKNEFLYYLLKHSVGQIKQNVHGAIFDTITKQTFDNIAVEIPQDTNEQSDIAAILSSLDDKIELNLKTNQTLEAIAQAIFKEWFVEFNFPEFDGKLLDSPLGKIPKGWSVQNIGDVNEVTDFVANGSFASLASNVKYKSEPDHAILIRLTDYHRNFNGDFVYVDENAYNFLKKSKLVGGEIVIANVGANAGEVFKVPELQRPMTLGPNAIMIKVNELSNYLYLLLISYEGQHLLKGIIAGSAQPKFNKTDFRKIKIIVPDSSILKLFNKTYKSIYDKILLNKAESRILTDTRDILLPKLITGQIEVPR